MRGTQDYRTSAVAISLPYIDDIQYTRRNSSPLHVVIEPRILSEGAIQSSIIQERGDYNLIERSVKYAHRRIKKEVSPKLSCPRMSKEPREI